MNMFKYSHKGSHQKKNYKILDIVQTWGGVCGAAKLFIEKRYGHVLISNFLCQNVQTSLEGGGVQAKSERPNFLRPYLPNGGGGVSGVLDNVQNLVVFFLMAPLTQPN